MSSLASLFAVPLTLVGEECLAKSKPDKVIGPIANGNHQSDANKCDDTALPEKIRHLVCEKTKVDENHGTGAKKASPKKKRKKQFRPGQVPGYVDYDKKLEDDVRKDYSSLWIWSGLDSGTRNDQESCYSPSSVPQQRELVSYQELLHLPNSMKNQHLRRAKGIHPSQQNNNSAPGQHNSTPGQHNSTPGQQNSTTGQQNSTTGQQNNNSTPGQKNSTPGQQNPTTSRQNNNSTSGQHNSIHGQQNKNLTSGQKKATAGQQNNNSIPGQKNKNTSSCVSNEYPIGKRNKNICPGQLNRNSLSGQQNTTSALGQLKPNSLSIQQGGNVSNKRKSEFPEPPNKIPRFGDAKAGIKAFPPIMSSADFIDPLVAATEKEAIFEKPVKEQNQKKVLSSKKRKKLENAKYYKEKLRLQMEKEKDRMASLKSLKCRFFASGSCNKGTECSYSHDFVPEKKQELCKFYVMSFCEKGSSCVYYHGDWPCKFFHVYRSCSQGDACRFSHQPLTDETRQLLEKSKSDTAVASVEAEKLSATCNVVTSSSSSSLLSPNLESERTAEGNGKAQVPFRGVPFFHPLPGVVPWQVPNGASTSGSFPIHHEPWNKTLERIDFDESHKVYLPLDIEFNNSRFINDPRVKGYCAKDGNTGKSRIPVKRELSDPLEVPRVFEYCSESANCTAPDEFLKTDVRFTGFASPSVHSTDVTFLSVSCSATLFPVSSCSSVKSAGVDDCHSARHFSLPLMQAIARPNTDKAVRNKPTSSSPSPCLSSSSLSLLS